ncbi:GNAT family N-acetyltransferase [Enterococcus olivae]
MKIQKAKQLTTAHNQLFLEADPAKELVAAYVKRGTVLEAIIDEKLVGVLVLLPTRPATLEIVNLVVLAEYRGQGIAQQLIQEALSQAKAGQYQTVEVGTGSTGVEQLYLYQKCGFRMTHIDRDFFVRHYPEPIIENGLVLRDMVRLAQDI